MPIPPGVDLFLELFFRLPRGRWTVGMLGLMLVVWGFVASRWGWSVVLWCVGGFLIAQARLSDDD